MSANAATALAPDKSYTRYLEALLAGDRACCRSIFESWLAAGTELRVLYQDLVQRSLYDVGALWEAGRVSVATEHLATSITESLLNLVYPSLFSRSRVGKTVVVSCAANEYHQIGGKLVADLFELHGWNGYFLGANLPVRDLLELIREKRPDAVALSLAVYFNIESLLEAAGAVRAEFPALPVLVGGQAFRAGGRERVEAIEGVRCLASLDELEAWIQSRTSHAR